MKNYIVALIVFSIFHGCGGGSSSGPDQEPPVPQTISKLTMTAGTSKVGGGYGWGCNGCFWPEYDCTQTTNLNFSFYLADGNGGPHQLSISWTDSLGTLSGYRVSPMAFTFDANQTVSFTIPAGYTDPGMLQDWGSGQANCTSAARTYTYSIHTTNMSTGRDSNSLTTTWTVAP